VFSRPYLIEGLKMLQNRSTRVALTVFLAACLGPAAALAQSSNEQQDSVADAAKRAREAKKNAPKPVKIVTDEEIDAKKIQPGAEGLTVDSPPRLETEPPSPGAVAAAEAADQARPTSGVDAPKQGDTAEITREKEMLAQALKDLDLIKRGLALDQDTYYSNPDYVHDRAGKAKLDAEIQQLADKQQLVDDLKARLASLGSRPSASAQGSVPPPAAPNPPTQP
jgi:hypothetical protein